MPFCLRSTAPEKRKLEQCQYQRTAFRYDSLLITMGGHNCICWVPIHIKFGMDHDRKESWISELHKWNTKSRQRFVEKFCDSLKSGATELNAFVEITEAHLRSTKWKFLCWKRSVQKTLKFGISTQAAPTLQVVVNELLSVATKQRKNELVKLLLEKYGADVNWKGNYDQTPLSIAVLKCDTTCAKLLLDAGADLNRCDPFEESPLFAAVASGDADYVQKLLKAGTDINEVHSTKGTALCLAVARCQTHCVKLLLDEGADVNQADYNGHTPLYLAVSTMNMICTEVLLKAGADVNQASHWGKTILMEGVSQNASVYVDMLLKAGADVNSVDKHGKTSLWIAASKGASDCVKLLLDAGAEVNKGVLVGTTPLLAAAAMGQKESVKLLLEVGADVNMMDRQKFSALRSAAWGGHTSVVRLLLEAGADVNQSSALSGAVHKQNAECVKLLVDAGADVNHPEEEEEMLLQNVLTWHMNIPIITAVVGLLLIAGVHINLPRRFFLTLDSELQIALLPLLSAAGMNHSSTSPLKFMEFESWHYKDLDLKNQCREFIRKHLLTLNPNTNLFKQVPQLKRANERAGLPNTLVSYLLYDQDLEVDF